MASRVVELAVRHQRSAMMVGLGAFIAGGVFTPLTVFLQDPMLMVITFAFFMSVAVLAWGSALFADAFGVDMPRFGLGLGRFAQRALKVYSTLFLIFWFGIGIAGLVASLVLLTFFILQG